MGKPKGKHVGKRYGRLFVIKEMPIENGRYRLQVKCDCGTVFKVLAQSLVSGRTKSCGCLRKELFAKRRTNRNLKKIDGRTITDWAHENNIKPETLYMRLKRGWNFERAINTPIREIGKSFKTFTIEKLEEFQSEIKNACTNGDVESLKVKYDKMLDDITEKAYMILDNKGD